MNLKEMRETAGLSQVAVAEKIGEVTQGAVSQWEQGLTYPKPKKIQILAELYGVTAGEIITAITESREQASA